MPNQKPAVAGRTRPRPAGVVSPGRLTPHKAAAGAAPLRQANPTTSPRPRRARGQPPVRLDPAGVGARGCGVRGRAVGACRSVPRSATGPQPLMAWLFPRPVPAPRLELHADPRASAPLRHSRHRHGATVRSLGAGPSQDRGPVQSAFGPRPARPRTGTVQSGTGGRGSSAPRTRFNSTGAVVRQGEGAGNGSWLGTACPDLNSEVDSLFLCWIEAMSPSVPILPQGSRAYGSNQSLASRKRFMNTTVIKIECAGTSSPRVDGAQAKRCIRSRANRWRVASPRYDPTPAKGNRCIGPSVSSRPHRRSSPRHRGDATALSQASPGSTQPVRANESSGGRSGPAAIRSTRFCLEP